MIIAPSVLNADNLNLKQAVQKAANAGITRFHIDIMDGHFVPNLSFGPQLVQDFKREFPMIDAEVHLMSDNPDLLVPDFVKKGADLIILHYEAMSEEKLNYYLDYLASNGVKAGLALNPETSVELIKKFASKIDQLLIMTVHPGFGGQKFIPDSLSKIKQAREELNKLNPKVKIEVDGGINDQTMLAAKKAGAEILVIGSYLYEGGNIEGKINKLTGKLK